MKYNYDKTFFKKIDTEEKAYFLGLMYTDGNVSTNNSSISICLQEQDVDVLESFKKAMNSNNTIYLQYSNNENHLNIVKLQFSSVTIAKDIIDKGCVPNKTKILRFPTEEQVPNHLIHHFIRGVFDGDGSVWEGKRKIMTVKDKTRKEGYRDRIVHNVKFNITGTYSMMSNIQNILINILSFKQNKLNTSKNIDNCVQLEYSGRGQMKKFYSYIYKDATVFIKRKKKKFEEILKMC